MERNYQRDDYSLEQDIPKYYRAIIDANLQTKQALNHFNAIKLEITSHSIEERHEAVNQAKKRFLNSLSYYFDLTRHKFDKTDEVEKPDLDKEIQELEVNRAVEVKDRIDRLLEELDITGAEQYRKGRREI